MTGEDVLAYWAEAQATIEDVLIPMAKLTKCIPASATLGSLRVRIQRFEKDDPKRQPAQAMMAIADVYAMSQWALKLRTDLFAVQQHSPHFEKAKKVIDEDFVVPSHYEICVIYERLREWLYGYLAALDAMTMFRTQRGAEKRRSQGNTTRERVKAAAKKYRHMPRDTAAVHISETVGKSPGTIRRLLSELFPGEKWYESIDLSQHIK